MCLVMPKNIINLIFQVSSISLTMNDKTIFFQMIIYITLSAYFLKVFF